MIRLAVRVRRADAEIVLAELLDLAPEGVEEVELGDELVEYAVYGSPGELPALPDLRAAAGSALVEIATSETPGDWQERWKRFHRPVLIEAPDAASARRPPALRVRPPWEPPSPPGDGRAEEIVIDPGQAFGTGAHATTRLCLELLLELAAMREERGPLLDIGAGSGLLAIAAARLGFSPVIALDNDRESVRASAENAALNGVSLEVAHVDVRSQGIPWLGSEGDHAAAMPTPPGPLVVVANLLRPLLLELAERAARAPDHLIAGGLLRAEADEIAAAFAGRLEMHERARRESGDWAAVWLTAG